MNRNTILTTILTIATLALQIFVSPLLNIGGTTINYCLAFLVAASVVLNEKPKIVLAVVFGLFMDLTQGEPFGAFTLVFLLSNIACISLAANVNSQSFQEKSLIAFIVCAIANVFHCLVVGLATPGLTLALAFLSGQLWSCLFDGLVSIIFLITMSKICSNNNFNAWSSRY